MRLVDSSTAEGKLESSYNVWFIKSRDRSGDGERCSILKLSSRVTAIDKNNFAQMIKRHLPPVTVRLGRSRLANRVKRAVGQC